MRLRKFTGVTVLFLAGLLVLAAGLWVTSERPRRWIERRWRRRRN